MYLAAGADVNNLNALDSPHEVWLYTLSQVALNIFALKLQLLDSIALVFFWFAIFVFNEEFLGSMEHDFDQF